MTIEFDFASAISKGLVDNSLELCSRWAENKMRMPAPYRGPLTFEHHPWQQEILNYRGPQVSIRKGAQLGFSVAAMAKALHTIDTRREDCLYILPTAQQASVFSQSRLDSVTEMSPELQDLFKSANSVGLKKTTRQTNLFIRGSVSESGLVSVPVSTVIIDEFDRCNVKALSLAIERMSSFEDKHLFALSTPTLPEFGIDEQYKDGTQEIFVFKCPSCSKHINLTQENLVVVGESPRDERTAESYLKCTECDAKIPHESKMEILADGFWEATEKAYGHRSFYINQLYSASLTPQEMAIAYLRGVGDEIAMIEYVNQKLGMGYIMKGGKVSDKEIDESIKGYTKGPAEPGDMVVMGVDVGSFLDICIAKYDYDEHPGLEPHLRSHATILFEGRLPGGDFEGLGQLMSEYQIQHCCIDFQPETNLAKQFARKFPGFVSLVQYRKGTEAEEIKAKDDDRVEILTVNRTAFLDYSVGRLHKGKATLPSDLSMVWREHICAPTRTYVLDDFGKPVATYLSNQPDHAAHAFALAEVAHIRAYERACSRSVL